MSSKLIKEAIADAKAVKTIALANAKAVLEEAFTPKLQSMLSAKLKEEIEEEEMEETSNIGAGDNAKPKFDHKNGATANADQFSPQKIEKWGAKGDHVSPTKESVTQENSMPGEGQPDQHMASQGEGEGMGGQSEEISSHEIDEILAELEKEAGAAAQAPEANGAPAPMADPNAVPVAPAPAPVDPNAAPVSLAPAAPTDADGDNDEAPAPAPHLDEEEVDVNEIIAALNETSEEEDDDKEDDKEEKKDGKKFNFQKETYANGKPGKGKDEVKETYSDGKAGKTDAKGPAKQTNQHETDAYDHTGKNLTAKLNEEKEAEYVNAIEYLKTQLNEVNLLNAKLLYTNKLFKSHSLNNSQKMKIIESFDLAKSIREVRITYNSMNEAFNVNTVTNTSSPVKKSTIVEGLASKSVATTKPAIVQSNGSEMAMRFKTLAGIKSKK